MKTIYVDNEFKCHTVPGDGMTAVETNFFDGYCNEFIEGYRLIPEGECWTREDGTKFWGGMVTPWRNYQELKDIQQEYEKQLLTEYAEALKKLGVEV